MKQRIALMSFLANSINVRTLSAYLKQNGYESICVFCPCLPNEANTQALIQLLKQQRISLVGISLVTDNYYSAVILTKAIKKELAIPVIWGGAHVNVMPDECLRHADMICKGEGEEALLDLARLAGIDIPEREEGFASRCHLCWVVRRRLATAGLHPDELAPAHIYEEDA